jgi:hypothetical protein
MKKIVYTYYLLAAALIVSGCNDKQPAVVPEEIKQDSTAGDSIPVTQHNHNYTVNAYAIVDVSPMDMSYYPVEYYKLNMARQTTIPLVARVIYSRPHLNGRKLFTDILKYGEPWRLGANEATEIQFFTEVTIQGKKIKPGRYILYSVPGEKNWAIILNSNLDTWGLHPDTSKDLFRFEAAVNKVDHHTEYFTMVFEKAPRGANLLMAWDDYEIKLPIHFSFE